MTDNNDDLAFYEEQRKIRFSDRLGVKHKFCLLEDISKPSALFIGFKDLSSGIRMVNQSNFQTIMATVDKLREYQIDAVPVFAKEATDPSKTVVTAGGIQTPVLEPNVVKDMAKNIFDALAVNDREMRQGFTHEIDYKGVDASRFVICAPVEVEQMATPAVMSQTINHSVIEAGLLNPDVDLYVKNREKFGFDLEYHLIKEAENSDKLLSLDDLKQSNDSQLTKLYRGGCLGNQPYLSLASRESKNFAYSTPDIATAAMYSGAGDYGASMKAFAENEPEGVCFGFVYEFEAGKRVLLFNDYGLETGAQPEVDAKAKDVRRECWEGKNFEMPVVPQKNKLANVYLHLKKDGKDMFYPVDCNEEKWAAFLQMYRTSDTVKRGHMIERRRNVLNDGKSYSSLNNNKSFGIFRKKVLPFNLEGDAEKLINEANLTIEEKMTSNNIKKRKSYTKEEVTARLKDVREKIKQKNANHAFKTGDSETSKTSANVGSGSSTKFAQNNYQR